MRKPLQRRCQLYSRVIDSQSFARRFGIHGLSPLLWYGPIFEFWWNHETNLKDLWVESHVQTARQGGKVLREGMGQATGVPAKETWKVRLNDVKN